MKRLSKHDAKELAQFVAFLGDIRKMSPGDFVRKHHRYMGLSKVEAERFAKAENTLLRKIHEHYAQKR